MVSRRDSGEKKAMGSTSGIDEAIDNRYKLISSIPKAFLGPTRSLQYSEYKAAK